MIPLIFVLVGELTAMKRHRDHNNSYKEKHLIVGGLLLVSVVQVQSKIMDDGEHCDLQADMV